jgi:hypothetical protein
LRIAKHREIFRAICSAKAAAQNAPRNEYGPLSHNEFGAPESARQLAGAPSMACKFLIFDDHVPAARPRSFIGASD